MKALARYRPLFAVLAVPLLLAACGSKEAASQKTAPAAPPALEVDVVTVVPRTVMLTQDLPGRLEAYRSAQVRARVEGIVEKRLFTEGRDVKAGDTLFLIDARNYQAAFSSAKADANVARQTVARYRTMYEAKALSQQDFELAEAKLKQAESVLSKAQIDLDNTHVPAAIDGRIGRAQVTAGALVGHGDATLLATIEQINPIYVNFTQPGSDVLRLQREMESGSLKKPTSNKVELILEDGSIYPQAGKLLFSNLAVDSSTGSVSLRAEFPNAKHELLPGMFMRIRLAEGSKENSIKVPQRALKMTPQGQFVMVVDAEGKAAMRPVKTGEMIGTDFVIQKGLNPDDKVIVNGLQKARPGTPVKALEWQPEGGNTPAPSVAALPEKK